VLVRFISLNINSGNPQRHAQSGQYRMRRDHNERGKPRMAFTAPGLYSRVRTMLPEICKFLVVGGLGTVIDLGGAGLLHSKYHVEPLAAKAISVTLATTFTYLGSRFWTFKTRENQAVHREAVLFFVLNVVGLLIAEAVIGLVIYVMGLRGPLAYNAASFVGTGCGTIFRFWAYRKWVFLSPEKAPEPRPLASATPLPDYPPWELDPAFLVPAEAAAPAPVPAPSYSSSSYSSPWERERERAAPVDHGLAQSPWGAPAPYSASAFPASARPAPVRNARPAPVPAAARRAPRSSGGGRHRKS
jgi:putative flippase GtrA